MNNHSNRGIGQNRSRGRIERLCVLTGVLLLAVGLVYVSRGDRHSEAFGQPSVTTAKTTDLPTTRLRTKSIEDIRSGDRVLAQDPTTGSAEAKPVVEVYQRMSDHLRIVTIRSANGVSQELRTTDGHPFWVVDGGWVTAKELQAGQSLPQPDGASATVVSTRREAHPEGVPVYNFQTKDYHTYFAAAQGKGFEPVLVHNMCASERPVFGRNGVQTPSTTVWKGIGRERIDIENPNPGQRDAQIHYQDNKDVKYLYDPETNSFPGAPKSVNKLLENPSFLAGIRRALRYLSED